MSESKLEELAEYDFEELLKKLEVSDDEEEIKKPVLIAGVAYGTEASQLLRKLKQALLIAVRR